MKLIKVKLAETGRRVQSAWYGVLVRTDSFCDQYGHLLGRAAVGVQILAVGALLMGHSHPALADSYNGYTGGGNTLATFFAGIKNNIIVPGLEYGTYGAYAAGVAAVGSALFDGWQLTKGRANGDVTVGKALAKGVLVGPGLGILGVLCNTGAETLKQSAGA
ncbi:hypothetical protein E2P84_36730 [Burkholderia cepacia]|uniref:Uncharacterized protein n=1 Tax=Burkholderia cepacia TaxID=292 RepID=A0AAX2RR43_BURCE|nr:hypothetical protein [Burkholderia cepacia]TES65677.1 hypothetical protein E2P84_36730 [Burkholderia cepacia]TET01667.1 hypothetical protein E3D36_16665 [Burkholderia cepacia]TEU47525.1 hypothetical protein E3D37_16095 [Burkholderia cepacia]TEU53552.1 hypothetical protein E3D38_12485 [Burkholderia cepacia]TEV02158.1 hypothetical protein E3D40_13415 [Burkholderia cepacia]